jgi:hypothetical protein
MKTIEEAIKMFQAAQIFLMFDNSHNHKIDKQGRITNARDEKRQGIKLNKIK